MSEIKINSVGISPETGEELGTVIGVVIPSSSGRDYPTIYYNYDTLEREFDDGEVSLSRYKYLFELGYQVAAVRVNKGAVNMATLRLSDPLYTELIATHPQYQDSLEVDRSLIGGHRLGEDFDLDNFTNVFRLNYKDLTKLDASKDYILIPSSLDPNTASITLVSFEDGVHGITGSEDFGPNVVRCAVNIQNKTHKQIRAALIDTIARFTGYQAVRGFEKEEYDIFYKYELSDEIEQYRLTEGSLEVSIDYNDKLDIYASYASPFKIMDFYCIIPGIFGNLLNVEIKNNKFKVYYDSELLESFDYTTTEDLFMQLKENSGYIDPVLYNRDKNLPEGTFFFDGGYMESERTTDDYLRAVELFGDEDIDIDFLSYDGFFDPELRILRMLHEVSVENQFIVLLNRDIARTYTDTPNIFYTLGTFTQDGIIYPTSYAFFKRLTTDYVGAITDKIYIQKQYTEAEYESFKRIGLNYIKYDGFNYYISYYNSSIDENPAYNFTMNRIQRKFRRLSQYLGASKIELHKHVQELIRTLKNSIYLVNELTLTRFDYDDRKGEVQIQLEVKLERVVNEVLLLNLVINRN